MQQDPEVRQVDHDQAFVRYFFSMFDGDTMSSGVDVLGMGRGKGKGTGNRFYRMLKRLVLQERAAEVIEESEKKRKEVEENVVDKWVTTIDGESKWFLNRSQHSIECLCGHSDEHDE